MSRIGTCLQCGQRYGDIPDSVTATRVKCKVCAGIVEVPPLTAPAAPAASEAAAPAPSAGPPKPVLESKPAPIPMAPRPVQPVAPAKPMAAVPSKPVFAPKPAAPVKPVFPAKPAAPVAPVARPTPPAAPAARPAPPVAPAARPAPPVAKPVPPAPKPVVPAAKAPAPVVRAAAAAPAAPAKLSAAEILAAAKAKRAAASAPAAHAAAPAAAVRSPAPAAAHAPTRRTAREEREHQAYQKPRSNTPMILTVVLLLVCAGAGGLYFMVNRGEDPVEPAPTTVLATPPAQPVNVPAASTVPTQPAASNAPAATPPTPAAAEPTANPEPAKEAPPAASQGFDANYVFTVPAAGQPVAVPRGKVDPAVLTLEKVPDLQRWSKTSDTTWTSVQGDLALYLENSGARSNRAGDALVKMGRDAYPAMVTAMMKQDYTTVDGVKMAGSLNDLVGKIVGGENFGWRSAERYPIGSDEWTDAVLLQKKVAIQRYNRWVEKLREGDSDWEIIAKKGGASGIRKDEEGKDVGDLPPDLPPDVPPDGR